MIFHEKAQALRPSLLFVYITSQSSCIMPHVHDILEMIGSGFWNGRGEKC
jgi:hypothetical protein